MEAIWITGAIVAGLVVVIVVSVCATQWANVRQLEADARLKQDMLARGLSVEEIERLTTTEALRQARIAADSKVREAQIVADTQIKQMQLDADQKRDMLAHGLSVEEIERLITTRRAGAFEAGQARPDVLVLVTALQSMVQMGDDKAAIAGLLADFLARHSGSEGKGQATTAPASPEASRARPDALGLATAIESMTAAGKNANEIAALLTLFLGQHGVPQETAPEPGPALPRWPAPGRIEESAPPRRPEHDTKDVREKRAESVFPAERRMPGG
jgi:hypothetical protein